LVDAENEIEIVGWELSTDTNFSGTEVASYEDALTFAETIGFPQHGLVAKYLTSNGEKKIAAKGLISSKALKQAIAEAIQFSTDGKVYLETDMRAMYNPTRMKVIEKATVNLLSKIKSTCPQCNWPGFEITEWVEGLPCESCLMPTKRILKHIYLCKKCAFEKTVKYPNSDKYCKPQECDFCNP